VFLFLPSEAAYAGALRADPNVLEFAIENRVSVVAPSTLLSTLTAVGSIWREFEANQHIDDALKDARELHKRLQTFVNHLNNLGTHLTRAVGAYNQSISSFDGRLIPQARKLEAANLAPGQVVLEVKPVTDGVNPVTTASALPTPDGVPTIALDVPLEDATD
jgi:DNA recombination protein RmuC